MKVAALKRKALNNNLLQQVSKRKQKEKEKMLKEDFLVSGQLSSSYVRKREGNRRKTWRKKERVIKPGHSQVKMKERARKTPAY